MPRNPSKDPDEFTVLYAEQRTEIEEQIDKLETRIKKLNSAKELINKTFSEIPESNIKRVGKLSFIDGLSAKEIGQKLGCSRQFVYKVTCDLRNSLGI